MLDKAKFYVPTGKQEELIKTFAASYDNNRIPVILCTFGNGAGKTETVIQTVYNLVFGAQNGWFDYEVFKNFKFPKNIWYCTNPDAIKERFVDEFDELLKSKVGRFVAAKEDKHYHSHYKFDTGWNLYLKSYNQDPVAYESSNVGVIICDEPLNQNLWGAIKSRRRLGCITLMVQTPLDTPPYIIDEIKTSYDNNIKGYYHIEGDIYSACKKRGVRGYLDPDTVDAIVETYDPEEREARVYGKFGYFSKTILNNLDRELHFVDPEDYPLQPNYLYYHVVDPHDARPNAEIWAAVTPEGRYIIFEELPFDKSIPFWKMKGGVSVKDDIEQIKFVEKKHNIHVHERIMDRHFGTQTRGAYHGETSYIKEYREAGGDEFRFKKSYIAPNTDAEILYGHKRIRECLKILPDGKPGLVIWNTCYHTWNGATHYVRKSEKTKSSFDQALGEGKIVEKYKDYPDVIRYLVCHNYDMNLFKKKSELYREYTSNPLYEVF